jgi:hypothetical protein
MTSLLFALIAFIFSSIIKAYQFITIINHFENPELELGFSI